MCRFRFFICYWFHFFIIFISADFASLLRLVPGWGSGLLGPIDLILGRNDPPVLSSIFPIKSALTPATTNIQIAHTILAAYRQLTVLISAYQPT